MEILTIFLVCLAAIIGGACAINFFWRIGPWKSLGYAAFFVLVFLIFWLSGLWENATRHSWGTLTPIFFLIIIIAGLIIIAGYKLIKLYLVKIKK